MIFILSPAKALDFETNIQIKTASTPLFIEEAAYLVKLLKSKSPQEVAELMHLSDKLALLNVARYANWQVQSSGQSNGQSSEQNSKPAVLAFNGDVYDGLQAKTLTAKQLEWAQQHLCILSGLYGVLRPLDLMQAYRLEMGTALQTKKGNNLYQYWGNKPALYLHERLAKGVASESRVLVNLASQEYFKAIDTKVLQAPVLECIFEEHKAGEYKVVSFYAKRARGLMMRFAIENKVKTPEKLKNFDSEGYVFAASVSTEKRFVFRRG